LGRCWSKDPQFQLDEKNNASHGDCIVNSGDIVLKIAEREFGAFPPQNNGKYVK
jgi:hypothetical protein